eukprot:15345164-Ditylum_brightwellii.AAC.1
MDSSIYSEGVGGMYPSIFKEFPKYTAAHVGSQGVAFRVRIRVSSIEEFSWQNPANRSHVKHLKEVPIRLLEGPRFTSPQWRIKWDIHVEHPFYLEGDGMIQVDFQHH